MEYKWIIYMKMNMKYMCIPMLFWILHWGSEMNGKQMGVTATETTNSTKTTNH